MKRVPAFVFILVATVGAGSTAGCEDPLCETFIEVANDSATDRSYDVVTDDEVVGTLSPVPVFGLYVPGLTVAEYHRILIGFTTSSRVDP